MQVLFLFLTMYLPSQLTVRGPSGSVNKDNEVLLL